MSLPGARFIKLNNQGIKSEIDIKDEYVIDDLSESEALISNGERAKCGDIFISNSGNFILVCHFCESRFDDMLKFGEHIRDNHLCNEQIFNDDEYAAIETKNIAPGNTKVGHEKPITNYSNEFLSSLCEDSNMKTDLKFDRLNGTAQTIEDADLFCATCNRQYKNKRTFRQHQIRHNSNLPEDHPKEESNDDAAIQSDLYCEICNRLYKSITNFRSHAVRHETIPLALQHNPDCLKCKYCDKQCLDNAEWDQHQRTHISNRPFPCPLCSKCFRKNSQRKLHMNTHTGERSFKCDKCPRSFSQAVNLRRHIRDHIEIKRFACEICGKLYLHKCERDVHMRTHTGEKPFQCEECGQSFILCSKLTEHRKRHTNIKNFKCEICGSLFYSNASLKAHKVKHSDARPHQCSECGSNFPRRKALKAHVKIHSTIKEYICNICGKEFAQAAGLYSHKKSHGEKLSLKYSDG